MKRPIRCERPARALFRRHPKKLAALAVLVGAPTLAHVCIAATTGIEPPRVALPAGEPVVDAADPDLSTLGAAYARHRGKILEVRLAGSPEDVGHQMGRLLHAQMTANEGALLGDFRKYVPFAPLRWLIMDVSRVEFRHVDLGMSDARRREIASQAAAFQPDAYDGFLPTYHRFVFLQSLYDIALSFEHSPLLGCTSFALKGDASAGGHVLLARNFDFEAGPIFDEKKAVFVVREAGRIPYASVAWPGLVGAVSGMNAEGVALVVHGARAREPKSEGEPVVHTMREVLATARSTAEAITILQRKDPMVSHMVFLVDAKGDVAVVERVPGEPAFVRRDPAALRVGLTNHLEGPLANDPANKRVETVTSTMPRRQRLDELLAALPNGATPADAARILRDKKGVTGAELKLGNRRAIDALIATHGVIFDVTARAVWVSEGPHLVGRFVKFDLAKLFDAAYEPKPGEAATEAAVDAIPADVIDGDGSYARWVAAGSPHKGEP
ncbi:MAG TPA: C45 family peptidase [Byssovorax sp.]